MEIQVRQFLYYCLFLQVDREHLALQVFFYTKNCKWLDVVELEFQAAPEFGTFVSARSFSSGFLPAWIPFAFLFNMVPSLVLFLISLSTLILDLLFLYHV